MFNDDLFEWIGAELKLPERALKLKALKKQKADLKTIVTVILCSADYYTESEIKDMLRLLDEVAGMPSVKRNCLKAKSLLTNRNYNEAASEYERIITSQDAALLTPEEFGDIYHNLAVAKVHTSGIKEASRLFGEAYERNHREESLKQYLYTLLIAGNKETFIDKTKAYQVEDTLTNDIESFVGQKLEEAEKTEQMKALVHLKRRKEQGKLNEFYKKAEEIIASWKAPLRQI